mmetsp:Transcript_5976/g.11514  ORF Transcript_5976/g.11514 Transcript_5976/m.11514 type:complete len:81 (+) Transcript_5976:310-552(+)
MVGKVVCGELEENSNETIGNVPPADVVPVCTQEGITVRCVAADMQYTPCQLFNVAHPLFADYFLRVYTRSEVSILLVGDS